MRLVDRSRTFRMPPSPLFPHVLHAHRFADRFRQYCGVHGAIVRIIVAIGTRASRVTYPQFVQTEVERECKAFLNKMGLLRTAPACHLAVLDLNERARRPHAGMGLEWPFVFSLDDLRGTLERLID